MRVRIWMCPERETEKNYPSQTNLALAARLTSATGKNCLYFSYLDMKNKRKNPQWQSPKQPSPQKTNQTRNQQHQNKHNHQQKPSNNNGTRTSIWHLFTLVVHLQRSCELLALRTGPVPALFTSSPFLLLSSFVVVEKEDKILKIKMRDITRASSFY